MRRHSGDSFSTGLAGRTLSIRSGSTNAGDATPCNRTQPPRRPENFHPSVRFAAQHMSTVPVSLSILVARTDVSFMRQPIPRLVRSCAYPFAERALVVDTAPLGAAYASRPSIGSAEDLRH